MIFNPKLKEFLEKKTGYAEYNGSNEELIIKCPFPKCELDRGESSGHGHLYISTKNPVYNCFKCNSTGSLMKLIKFLGGDCKDYLSQDILNTNYMVHNYKRTKNFGETKHVIKDQIFDNYKLKVHYLRSRLGFDYELDKISGLVLNIREFLNDNNIVLNPEEYTDSFLEYLQTSFVGFITTRGTKLLCRNINKNDTIEHHKIDLVPDNNYFKDFYGFKVAEPYPEGNTIVLMEGIFDLLVSINSPELFDLKQKSCYWAAVLSSYYNKTILSVLDICKIPSAHIIILADTDQKERIYQRVFNNISVLSLNIYYNKYFKDFGDLPIIPVKTKYSLDYKLFNKRRYNIVDSK